MPRVYCLSMVGVEKQEGRPFTYLLRETVVGPSIFQALGGYVTKITISDEYQSTVGTLDVVSCSSRGSEVVISDMEMTLLSNSLQA